LVINDDLSTPFGSTFPARFSVCLQASAADNGQCLVHDVTAFNSNGVVDGMVNCVAAANVSEVQKDPDCIKAMVWHGAELLLVGTQQGKHVRGLHAMQLV
jgi:hypothetical protein